ncbi:Fc.00g009700.m01.CDS01 [Cosmosporella sp. VM-42]
MTETTLSLVEASIGDLKKALNSRALTSVELVSLYIHRIGKYDCRGPSLNSVCVLNPSVFEDAQASDDYRASGQPPRALEGIPFTVKDSFQVKGMTIAAGSPAFSNLIASSDAAIVESLRAAGAIILGKTNMPPMADGGIQRGYYGRAESPYNPIYSTTAYASGSSNGCGTSTTSSFAAFGFAGETVTSGRSPASNNALVGYSPSRGVIPNRGQWPLYPTCDVIVPHTRSMKDLFDVLNVIVEDDINADQGLDFWRNQTFVPVPKSSEVRPVDYHSLEESNALHGKRIALPRCFLGVEGTEPPHICTDNVLDLWMSARAGMEALGATLVDTDFPLLEEYSKKDFPGQSCNVPGMSNEWVSIERCQMIATAWDDFLRANGDTSCPNLTFADVDKIRPNVAPLDDPSRHTESQNQVRYSEMLDAVRVRNTTIYDLPGCEGALKALEAMRRASYEEWMDENGFDLVAFPTNGDVPFADADENLESMLHALHDGIKYANGGRALKHLGVPCITLPMGNMKDKGMPVGLTFCAKGWDDTQLLRCAYAYEAGSKKRVPPPLTPPIPSDEITFVPIGGPEELRPSLKVQSVTWNHGESSSEAFCNFSATGTVEVSNTIQITSITAFVNGDPSPTTFDGNSWVFDARLSRPKRNEGFPIMATVPRDQFMVVIVAKASNGRCAAIMLRD